MAANGEVSSYCASTLLIHSVYSFNGLRISQMSAAGTGVTVEKLDRIFFCNECRMVFLFKLDATEHQKMTHHTQMREMPFEG